MEDSSTAMTVFLAVMAFVLVACNGFFVLSEFAIVKVRRSRLEELSKNGVANSELALKILHRLDSYLSATQLGITLSSLALGWIGEPAIARLLERLITPYVQIEGVLLHTISFIIAFTTITLMHVVLGEIVPKSIAIAKAEQSTLVIARPLHIFWVVFNPVIRTFDIIAGFFLRRIGIEAASDHESAHSEEELKYIVGESLKGGVLDSLEGSIIKNAVDFSDTNANEVMTPRRDIIFLKAENSYEKNLEIILNSGYTRFPFCVDNIDKVTGLIHIRDLLQSSLKHEDEKDLSKLVREMIIIPETTSISKVLQKMNEKQIHTAIVLDEYGGTAGLLTLEDIVEEIMGDISDEHDLKSIDYVQISEGVYEFDGMTPVDEAIEVLNIDIEEPEQVTLGGYVFNLLDRVPVIGDTISDKHCEYEVIEVDGARIIKLKATLCSEKAKEQDKETEE